MTTPTTPKTPQPRLDQIIVGHTSTGEPVRMSLVDETELALSQRDWAKRPSSGKTYLEALTAPAPQRDPRDYLRERVLARVVLALVTAVSFTPAVTCAVQGEARAAVVTAVIGTGLEAFACHAIYQPRLRRRRAVWGAR